MKKLLCGILVVACLMTSALVFVACGGNEDFTQPNFTSGNSLYTIKFVSNTERDFDFPISGLKLDHSAIENEKQLQYAWAIYDAEDNIVGWIETGNGYNEKNGVYTYGYCPSYVNEAYTFEGNITVILRTKDLSVFDEVSLQTNVGTVGRADEFEPKSATERYVSYDDAQDFAGAENFSFGEYIISFGNLKPKDIGNLQITVNIPDLG